MNEDATTRPSTTSSRNASCTTNGLAPVAKVLHRPFGIQKGLLTTVHSYTNSQRLLDVGRQGPARCARGGAEHRAVRRPAPPARSAWSSRSCRASSAACPSACPTPTVSVVDFTAVLDREVTKDEINEAMAGVRRRTACKGILGYTEEPLVSIDLKGDTHSSIFSALDTMVARQPGQGRRLVRQRVGLRLPPGRPHRVRRERLGARQAGWRHRPTRAGGTEPASRTEHAPMDKLTVRDFDAAGKRVLVRVDFNVPDRRRPRSPTTRASAPRCPRSIPARARARRRPGVPPRPARRQGRRVATPAAGRPAAGASCSAAGAASPRRVGIGSRRSRSSALTPAGVLLLENMRFHAEEEANDAGLRRGAGQTGRALRQRRIRHGASRARLDRRVSHLLPAVRRPADGRGDQSLSAALETPSPPICRRRRRRQGLG